MRNSGREPLGIDVGGVLIDRASARTDTSFFGDNYLRTPATPGAFVTIRRLVEERFGNRVHLISKCGPDIERKTREWLDHRRFFGRTGIRREYVHFCRVRADKAVLCSQLGITHFVDDRLEVLAYMKDVPHRYLFRPTDEEVRRHAEALGGVTRVDSWAELLSKLLHH